MGETEIGEVAGLEAPDGPVPSAQGVSIATRNSRGERKKYGNFADIFEKQLGWHCFIGCSGSFGSHRGSNVSSLGPQDEAARSALSVTGAYHLARVMAERANGEVFHTRVVTKKNG